MVNYYKQTRESKAATGTRKARLSVLSHESPTVRLDSNWSGGSRSTFALLKADTGQRCPFPSDAKFLSWDACGPKVKESDFLIPAGYIVLETGTFCGKTAAPSIHGRPDDCNMILRRWAIDPADTI